MIHSLAALFRRAPVGWWDLADKEKDPAVKEGLLKRARYWYRHAFPNATGLAKAKVEKRIKSDVSPMPKGLLDKLTREEVLDLIAYVTSKADPKHKAFSGGGHEHHQH